MNFFDSHAHLTDPEAFENLDEVIKRAKEKNISKILNICTDASSLDRGINLSKKYDFIYNAAATTPNDVQQEGEIFFPLVEKAIIDKKIIAIGETGLDYFYEYSHEDIQKEFLIKYFNLAIKYDPPIIIHCRDAYFDLFKIADEYYKDRKLLIHCFTGSLEDAKEALRRGWFLSFSGIVTFKNSPSLREIIKEVPIEKLLIETDSPLLAPNSKRGQRNEPANLIEIAQMVADVKQIDLKEIALKTFENTKKFFNIS